MMKKRDTYKLVARFISVMVVMLLLGLFVVSTTQASPPAQDPRDPFDAGNDGSGGGDKGDDKGDGDKASEPLTCGSVSGQIINWGYRPEPNLSAVLKTDSWELSAISANDGNYKFGGLGVGIAKLNVLLAPQDPLRPFIRDAAVYLTCDFPTVANVALYSGPTVEPPVTFDMSASSNIITSDRQTQIILTIINDLPTEITNVILTNLMAFGLKTLDVSTSAEVPPENLRIIDGGDDGRLVAVYLDKLAAGAKETITLTVTMIEDAPIDPPITNTATLFYRESVAVQASLDFSVGRNRLVIPAAVQSESAEFVPSTQAMEQVETEVKAVTIGQTEATPASRPQPSPTAAAVAARTDASTPGPEAETAEVEATEEAPASADEFLPITGNNALDKSSGDSATVSAASDTDLIGPLSGVGLVVLALVAYTWRSIYRRSEE